MTDSPYSPNPAVQPSAQPQTQRPNDFLVWAVISTLFCFPFTGIVGVISAARVNALWEAGRLQEAQAASRSAKTWALVSTIIGLVIIAGYATFVAAIVAAVLNDPSLYDPSLPTP